MSEQYDPDHHISFSFTDTWDTPVNLKASIVMEWCKYKEIAEQLQKRIDELESQLRWIPVSERLPEITDGYLTVQCGDFYDIQILTFRGGVFGLFDDLDGWIGTEDLVTHWRPLPEPPEVTNE